MTFWLCVLFGVFGAGMFYLGAWWSHTRPRTSKGTITVIEHY